MFDVDYMPADERAAHATLQCMGIEAVRARSEELGEAAKRRFDEYNHPGSIPVSGFTAIDYLTPEEREDFHVLRLAMQVEERRERSRAHNRIMQRRADRRFMRQARRQQFA